MKIKVNGKELEVSDRMSVADFMVSQGVGGAGYAVAVGGKVVPRDKRAEVVLVEGDELMIIKAVCGG